MDNKGKFYGFSQNNSGGSFIINDYVCEYVIIEAFSSDHANERAENVGIYFNGCDTGDDCPCCGDRWNSLWGDDEGYDVPSLYGEPVENMYASYYRNSCIVHYLDGRSEKINFKLKNGIPSDWEGSQNNDK